MKEKISQTNTNLDPEEIIEFEYYDRINKKKVIIKDKRKIKTALDELDKHDRKQESLIRELTERSFDEEMHGFTEENFEQFEQDLESVFQEVVDKIAKKEEDSKKIKKFLKEHIASLSEKQLNVLFLYYFLDFSVSEIGTILKTSKQRISQLIKKINRKLREKAALGG